MAGLAERQRCGATGRKRQTCDAEGTNGAGPERSSLRAHDAGVVAPRNKGPPEVSIQTATMLQGEQLGVCE